MKLIGHMEAAEGHEDMFNILASGENFSDMDDVVRGAAAGMRGLRHADGGPGQPLETVTEHAPHGETEVSHPEDLELDGMLVNLRGLA